VPVARGRVAVDFDQGIGYVVNDELDGAEVLEQRLDLGTSLGIPGIRRAVPYSVLDEQIGNRNGIGVCRSTPAAVV